MFSPRRVVRHVTEVGMRRVVTRAFAVRVGFRLFSRRRRPGRASRFPSASPIGYFATNTKRQQILLFELISLKVAQLRPRSQPSPSITVYKIHPIVPVHARGFNYARNRRAITTAA